MEIKDYAFAREVLEASRVEKAIRDRRFYERQRDYFEIERVIFNPPATIVIWKDGTKTVVKCNGEKFDQEKGLSMAISKRALAVGNRYHKTFKKFVSDEIPYRVLGYYAELKQALNGYINQLALNKTYAEDLTTQEMLDYLRKERELI